MLISTNLPNPANPGAADVLDSRAAANFASVAATGSPAAGSATEPDSDASRLLGLFEPESDLPDSSAAEMATNFLGANMLSQPGVMSAAQANLNPQTVYKLLQ